MELVQIFNNNLEMYDMSERKLRYLSTLLTIADKIKKYPELFDVTSITVTDLEVHTLPKLRRLAHCIGITQAHTIPSKEQLIQQIVSIYEILLKNDQNVIMETSDETQEEEDEKVAEQSEEEDSLQDVTETEEVKKRKREEQEQGFVYVFSNPMYSYYGENVYKIGYSKDPEKRVHDFDTGYPEETTIVYTYQHERARNLEQSVHKALDIFRLFPNREFFKCSITTIREFVESLGDKM